ncbi:hypothetical protein WJX81_002357 [Elliptochloris bilobata]|uniref:Uncharacterized protein n=1 Tax=Elliptochloris bilobata TaxID=381761 RepID=A0AAW1S5F3_9CHLO
MWAPKAAAQFRTSLSFAARQRGLSFTACCCQSKDGLQDSLNGLSPSCQSVRGEAQQGLPEPLTEEEQSESHKAEVTRRKGAVVRAWLEDRLGAEQVALVKILQSFGVVVRGGPEDGKKLVTALLEWKQQNAQELQEAWQREYMEASKKK